MNTPEKQNYFLWQSTDSEGKKIYFQLTSTSAMGFRASFTYWPEYAFRSTQRVEMEKAMVTARIIKDSTGERRWHLILIEMDIQQLSWANPPKEMKEYKNLLTDLSLYALTEDEEIDLGLHKEEMESKYANSRV